MLLSSLRFSSYHFLTLSFLVLCFWSLYLEPIQYLNPEPKMYLHSSLLLYSLDGVRDPLLRDPRCNRILFVANWRIMFSRNLEYSDKDSWKNKPSPNKRESCKILIAAVNTCHFNVKPPVCYKSVHSFRVTYLFTSQYYTKGYNLLYCTTNVLASLLLYTKMTR